AASDGVQNESLVTDHPTGVWVDKGNGIEVHGCPARLQNPAVSAIGGSQNGSRGPDRNYSVQVKSDQSVEVIRRWARLRSPTEAAVCRPRDSSTNSTCIQCPSIIDVYEEERAAADWGTAISDYRCDPGDAIVFSIRAGR